MNSCCLGRLDIIGRIAEHQKDDAESAYDFMQWCDRLSLILCQHQIPEAGRTLEISKGPDGTHYSVKQGTDSTLTVVPWCFEEEKFVVNAEASDLSEIKFEGNTSLIAALKQAPRKILEWTFSV
jgi:hypothetical protein